MRLTRPQFAAPVLVIDEFLNPDEAELCLQECIDLKPIYMPSTVGFGGSHRTDPSIRTNEVIFLDTVFGADPSRSAILRLIAKQTMSGECNRLWHDGYSVFDLVNYATWRESTLSRYGSGQYYEKHQDTIMDASNRDAVRRRIVTMCYYMNRTPKRFSGGAIKLYEGGQEVTIEPEHNRLIVFPSFTFHQVQPVELEDAEFDSGRFSLNYWLGFR